MAKARGELQETGDTFLRLVKAELPNALAAQGDEPAAVAQRKRVLDEFERSFAEHKAAVDAMVSLAVDYAAATESAATSESASSATALLWQSLAIMGVSITMCWWVARGITVPLKRVVNGMEQVAEGEGDLRQQVDDQGDKSVIGHLARSFNQFSTTVNNMIVDATELASDVGTSTETIAAATEQTAQSMDLQARSVEQIGSSIEEMSAFVTDVTSQTESVLKTAAQAGEVAREGDGVVARTIEMIREIETAVSAGASKVESLGSRSDEIGRVIDVINDIADQTNLLALNAAIEAARAGEHGRGFAVVADEVRKLAERTTKATEEVAGSIRVIQDETKQAMELMSQGTQQVRSGVESAGQASQGLQRIVSVVGETAQAISSIATAMNRQSKLTSEIKHQVSTIVSASREVAQANTSTSHASAALNTKSQNLTAMLSKFRTDRRKVACQRIQASPGTKCSLGEVLDYHPQGARVRFTESTPTVGQVVSFRMQHRGVTIQVDARVAWIDHERGSVIAGLRFLAEQRMLDA
jgi:methyl-accepting chemotaxis protein